MLTVRRRAPTFTYRPLGRAEIALAIPPSSRRARSQAAWLAAVQAEPELADLRADRQRNILEAARILARYADWRLKTTRPTRALICRLAGISLSTWKACRKWLEAHGFLALVRGGRTPWLRAGVLVEPDAANEAAIYVLIAPRAARPSRITRPLSPSDRTVVSVPAQAKVKSSRSEPARAGTHPLEAVVTRLRIGPGRPGGRRGLGEPITDGWAAYLVRPFVGARWTPSDLKHAIDWRPDGKRHDLSLKSVKHPRAWLQWRLTRWIGPDGIPLTAPSELRAQAAARDRAAAAERRAAAAAASANRVDPQKYAQRIRAEIGRGRKPRWERSRMSRWIQYANTEARAAELNGQPREGQAVEVGPMDGTAWVLPADGDGRRLVLVHLYPNRPEANYALDAEQPLPKREPAELAADMAGRAQALVDELNKIPGVTASASVSVTP